MYEKKQKTVDFKSQKIFKAANFILICENFLNQNKIKNMKKSFSLIFLRAFNLEGFTYNEIFYELKILKKKKIEIKKKIYKKNHNFLFLNKMKKDLNFNFMKKNYEFNKSLEIKKYLKEDLNKEENEFLEIFVLKYTEFLEKFNLSLQ